MLAEIITIGDEILIGQITDTNSQWISQKLNEIGVSVFQITSIQDESSHIIQALHEAGNNADIIIMTGGLGPTKDDLTKHTLTEYFGDRLVRYPEIEKHIQGLFKRINYPYTDIDMEQAQLPEQAQILKNNLGTASGMWFERDGKVYVSLPGVPNEMKGLMENEVLNRIRDNFHLPFILHRTLQTYGLGESRVSKRLGSFENQLPSYIKLAYLPSYGRVRLRLSAKGKNRDVLNVALEKEVERLKALVDDILIGEQDGETLELMLNRQLTSLGATLSLAESCTGGNISKMITSVPGASAFLRGSLVAYHQDIKTRVLEVPKSIIEKYSVVSSEVAVQMANRCRDLFQTDYAISTTGNAGPTTDLTDKSVGDVYIGIATPSGTYVSKYNFGQPRDKVIKRASVKGLELLRKEILKNTGNILPD